MDRVVKTCSKSSSCCTLCNEEHKTFTFLESIIVDGTVRSGLKDG